MTVGGESAPEQTWHGEQDSDPARALGHLLSIAAWVPAETFKSVFAVAGVTPTHTGIEHSVPVIEPTTYTK